MFGKFVSQTQSITSYILKLGLVISTRSRYDQKYIFFFNKLLQTVGKLLVSFAFVSLNNFYHIYFQDVLSGGIGDYDDMDDFM